MSANKKVQLSGDPEARYEEGVVSTAELLPGMLAELVAAGTLRPNGTQAQIVVQRIVTEQLNTLQGKTIDDAYAVGELCSFFVAVPGDRANLLLQAGQNVVKGDLLIADNDGTFIKTTGTPAQTVWEAEEALDLSGGGAVDTHVAAMRI